LSRRVSLPAADDLFRPTAAPTDAPDRTPQSAPQRASEAAPDDGGHESAPQATPPEPEHSEHATTGPAERGDSGRRDFERGEPTHGRPRQSRRPSGRVRHDEKMTVYVTADELLDLEHARLLLRRDHDLAVDRGRLVREAVAIALADLDARGEDSVIVKRLKQS
jgi:hypothetical protein